MNGQLILHRGARYVDRKELDSVPAPPSTRSWHPLRHGQVLATVQNTLVSNGYNVRSMKLGLSKDNQQFFGVIDLDHQLATGVTLAVGVRNSVNKTFPLGFVAGGKCIVCDNLCFRSELLVKRKHTRFGMTKFASDIGDAVDRLGQFKMNEADRIQQFQKKELADQEAESLILRCFEQGIVSGPILPTVIAEWRNPSHQWGEKTLWTLENCCIFALAELAERNPARFATLTIRLTNMLAAEVFSQMAV